MEKRKSQLVHGHPMDEQEACFACATQVWFAVNHNTSVTSGEMNLMFQAYCTGK